MWYGTLVALSMVLGRCNMTELNSDVGYFDLQKTPYWKYQLLKRPYALWWHFYMLRKHNKGIGILYGIQLAFSLTRYVR